MIFSDKFKATLGFSAAVLSTFALTFTMYQKHQAELESVRSQAAVDRARVALADYREDIAVKLVLLTQQVQKSETKLNEIATEIRKQTNEQVTALTAQRDGLLQRLRLAEARRASQDAVVSQASAAARTGGVAQGSDGAEVLGSFGEEDVREAYRADLIRIHLAGCYRLYGEARQELKGIEAK